MSLLPIEFVRNVAGGHEVGDRVEIEDTEYARGLITAGLAVELPAGSPAVAGAPVDLAKTGDGGDPGGAPNPS